MTTLEKDIAQALRSEFGEEVLIDFHDEKGDGKHFFLDICSEKFIGKTRIEQSRLVYACIDDFMKDGSIHALRMKCRTS